VVFPPDPVTYKPCVFLLSDTVGFIRKLPHQLIESFKSTLAEVIEADILLHVVDVSHSQFEEQMETVAQTLSEIEASDKPVITIFNKIDQYQPDPTSDDIFHDSTIYDIPTLKKTWMAKLNDNIVFISAKQDQNIEELKDIIRKNVTQFG
jgi:GTP-binding protein HflX